MPARKSGTSTSKSAARPKKSTPPPPRKKTPSKGRPSQAVPPPKPARASWWGRLSLNRKLDLLGVVLAMLGLLTLLSLLSSSNSWLTSGWLALLRQGFGWGMLLLPLGLVAIGLWLVLRHFESLPQFDLTRLAGLVLGFILLLAWLHFFSFPADRAANFVLAAQAKGGGYLGATLLWLLRPSLGWAGAFVALLAGSLIAVALVLDLSVSELFGWIPPLVGQLRQALRQWLQRPLQAPGAPTQPPAYPPVSPTQPADRTGQEASTAPAGMLPSYRPGVVRAGPTVAWILPPVDQILEAGGEISHDEDVDIQRARLIEDTLASFGAPAKVVEINRGPTITQFGVEPGFLETRAGPMRVRVSKIAALADDLALALSARRIRIQAPVPSKGYVGIEVPNDAIALVALRDVIDSEAFRRLKSPLRFALGQDVAGVAAAADLSAMPHLLIAGATGSGKSVCVNALICCLLLHNTPDDLRMLMVDPKRVELTNYNGIPHLLAPVVVELERVVGALQWVAREMDQRYHKLAQAGARNINDYNARLAAHGQKPLPYLVVVIDELADLMMLAPDETERTITRLAQLARATGIHLVIATQRPSVDVVTGLIKANFPARVAFAVASGVDSRVILDQPGAERLLGRGDMLFQAPDAAAPVRLQGAFVSDPEIQRLVDYWRGFAGTLDPASTVTGGVVDALPVGVPLKQMPMWEDTDGEADLDPLYAEAVDLVRRQGRASISMLQRRLRIGYTRAARLIESMQERGIVGPNQPGSQGLEVLDYGPAAPPVEEQGD